MDVLPPVAILRVQESALSRKTEGILRAEVRTESDPEKVTHFLILIAPALSSYQVELLQTSHDWQLAYPAKVKSRGLLPPPKMAGVAQLPGLGAKGAADERTAETQEEFTRIVGEILKSGWVRSLIQSLIARSNEIVPRTSSANGASTPTEDQPEKNA